MKEKNPLPAGKKQNLNTGPEDASRSDAPAVLHLGSQSIDLAKALRMNATRREFIKTGVAAGVGVSALLAGLDSAHAKKSESEKAENSKGRGRQKPLTEMRDFVFDCGHFASDDDRLVLVTGSTRTKLRRMSKGRWNKLCRKHPVLKRVPPSRASHFVSVPMPADAVQWCYVKRYRKGVKDGTWSMSHFFIHHPISALKESRRRVIAKFGEAYPVPIKWEEFGVAARDILALADPVGLDVLKTSSDTAEALVQSHPEMSNGDPNGSAYVNSAVVNGDQATRQSTTQCGQIIQNLGPIEKQSKFMGCESSDFTQNPTGYGTNIPICDESGEIALDSHGDELYVPIYNKAVVETAGSAMSSGLTAVKDDTTLGGNITNQPTPTPGLIWRSENGVSNMDQTDGLGANAGLDFNTHNNSPGHGYSCKVEGVEEAPGLDGVLTIKVKNWYPRFLGIYVRYLDADGNPIGVKDLGFTDDQIKAYFPFNGLYDTDHDLLLNLLGAEFEFLGIPMKSASAEYKVPVPEIAVTARILASGMGNQSKSQNEEYYDTTLAGATMTGCFNLSLPTFFLASNAAAGLEPMFQDLQDNDVLITLFPLVMDLMVSFMGNVGFEDPAVFEQLGVQVGKTLLKKGASALVKRVAGWEAQGESEEDVTDAIPVVGVLLSAVYAIGAAVSIAETAYHVSQSPSTYIYDIDLVHEIDVVISPDPLDGGGNWPATATTLNVLLQFDNNGTPCKKVLSLADTTVSGPITVTFGCVPLGGNVTASCSVLTENNILVGKGALGPQKNIEPVPGEALKIAFAIKELLIPLDESTFYRHKELIVLDDQGNHVWEAALDPPAEAEPPGCGLTDGQLCALSGIAVNTTAGDVGYLWRSYNSKVVSCDNSGGATQLYQFANISDSQDPQSRYFFSKCGFATAPLIVYDLINTKNNNYYLDTTSTGPGYKGGIVRQIRLDAENPGFDAPDSNRAFGKFRWASSAMLLHPAGQLISISADQNKFEVIPLPPAAVTDEQAPFSQPYGGQGLRPGLMGGPTLAALAPDGSVLVLERDNNRIQAFDLNANPVPLFADGNYFIPLQPQDPDFNVTYLDIGVEFKGYVYVLYTLTSKVGGGDKQFYLDIYTPEGKILSTTSDFRAARLTVGYFRDIYTENFQVLTLPDNTIADVTEPSISHWIPTTPQLRDAGVDEF